jgi:hypothetical protein
LVFFVIARRKFSGSSGSTNVVSMPSLCRGRDQFVARLHDGEQRRHLRRHARGQRQRGAAAFHRRHAFLEHRDGGVAHAAVDVAEGLQVEERRRMVGAVEHERRRLVNRRGARAGGGIGNLARVQAQRFYGKLVIG